MGYVFNEIFWWVLAALVIGFFLGWLFWKCRVWLSGADTGGRNAAELAALAESNEAEIASLRSELDGRASTVSELTGKLQLADSKGLELRSRIDELEARASLVPGLESEVAGLAAMRSRMNDLESDNAQIPRLNARIQELEAVSSELGVVKSRVADLAEQNGQVPALQARITELEAENARIAELEAESTEAQSLRVRIAELEAENTRVAGMQARISELEAENARIAELEASASTAASIPTALSTLGSEEVPFEADSGKSDGSGHPQTLLDLAPAAISDDGPNGDQPEPELDLDAAAAVLGKRIRKDDLTAVEGIGPKISDIIRSDGVTTWRSLSLTSPGHIKGLLDAAGPRFQMHDPGTWPEQAGLLADGRWEDFVALTAELDGGVRRTGDRPVGSTSEPPTIDLDFEAAAGVLGFTPAIDDLKVVEGIGPAIERLLNEAGIDSWLALAGTDPAVITSILEEAGPRFRIHDPGTWPTQAGLLSEGRWEDFKILTDDLKGGRV